MKITKNANNRKLEFYRDTKKGRLREPDKKNSKNSTELIKKLDLGKSFQGRILAYNKDRDEKNKNKFCVFVQSLVEEDKTIIAPPKIPENENKKNFVKNNISPYGRKLKYGSDEENSLGSLLNEYYTNNANIDEQLKKIKNRCLELKDYKENSLIKSFDHNKIPFEVRNGKLEPTTEKMKWLFSFLKPNGLDKPKFEQYQEWYQYNELKEILKSKRKEHYPIESEKGYLLANAIYDKIKKYNYAQLKKPHDDEGYSFFLDEVRDHFRKYFPVTGSKNAKQARLSSLENKKNAEYYCSERYVFQQVWRQIVNKLTAGLIQYGKLTYYYNDNGNWNKGKLDSEGMQEIQVQETFKKQLLLAVVWSVNKLNYIFNYGGDNADTLGTSDFEGDILLSLENAFSANQDKRESSYLLKTLQDIEKDPNAHQVFDKLSIFYPLEETEKSSKSILDLIKVIHKSVYDVRNAIIHYKKGKLNFGEASEISSRLLHRDIDRINECFFEQIQSMNIADYYSPELVENVFVNCGLEFKLYAPQVPMVPSFRKVFDKGVNLGMALHNNKRLEWYVEEKKDPEVKLAKQAYRNLIQLIYYHGFLPAIAEAEKEKLITDHIKETIEWNKKLATQKKGVNRNQYRYHGMPEFSAGMTLSEYMKTLQREQSNKEKDNLEKAISSDEKKNYYTKFVQDLYVFAFGDFLESKLGQYKAELLQPSKPESVDENKLKEQLKRFKMSTKLENQKSDVLLAVYPFFKLLDPKGLNQLQHQFIRFRTSVVSGKMGSDIAIKEVLNGDIEELIALIAFTQRPFANTQAYEQVITELSESFIEGDPKEYGELYYQSDEKHPILHRNIAHMRSTGVLELYRKVFGVKDESNDFWVKKSDYQEYRMETDCEEGQALPPIGRKKKELQELHETLVRNPRQKDQWKKYGEYEKLANESHEYDMLKKRVTFESMYEIYQLHATILGRLASFAEDWERDMLFLLTALKSRTYIDVDVPSIFEEGNVVRKMEEQLGPKSKNGDKTKLLQALYCLEEESAWSLWSVFRVRNSVAHLNHVTQKAITIKKAKETQYQQNIVGVMNRLRRLLAYDMKRQNAVTQAIQKIFDQHQMVIKFKPLKIQSKSRQTSEERPRIKNIDFEVESIKDKQMEHLKKVRGKKMMINAYDSEIIKAIDVLMKYQYNK